MGEWGMLTGLAKGCYAYKFDTASRICYNEGVGYFYENNGLHPSASLCTDDRHLSVQVGRRTPCQSTVTPVAVFLCPEVGGMEWEYEEPNRDGWDIERPGSVDVVERFYGEAEGSPAEFWELVWRLLDRA